MLDEKPVSQIAREYETLTRLFDAQPVLTRHFLEQQAMAILSALEQGQKQVRFRFPDAIILEGGEMLDLTPASRERHVGNPLKRLRRAEMSAKLDEHLQALEQSLNPGLSACGTLMRIALARIIIFQLVPDGRSVHYLPESGDDIPSIPTGEVQPGALLAASDARIAPDQAAPDRDHLQVPFVDAARRFYLPQWVAFDEENRLLVGSFEEAETCIASLRNTVLLLEEAVTFCPCLVADETYQRKRAGLLGQLVNQGRALARGYTREITGRIHQRAASGSLNRGLRLSLPYFNDESLSLQLHPVEVIPDGRILFIPALVVRAIRLSAAQVRQDAHFTPSTRKHLLAQLTDIEKTFNGNGSH